MDTSSKGRPLVLCVDDDQMILDIEKIALERVGYQVVTASDGRDALRTFMEEPVSAVVLDYEMPGLNGTDLAKVMKRLHPEVPKLLFTGSSMPAEAAPFVEGYCPKMGGLRALLLALASLLPLAAAGTRIAS
jgi:DNA-binding NtrC family response regulator